ncbi:sulfite reductase subunit alpha [Stenotrophobium rhamnosiphilum]|uniref:NADPH--hemoprotein reductase n=1 Tax=Stenotrophobium rhamnosiphilum TaxID=2029166 RepID=A0A2T5MKU7_9GAMM|nr:sulfite reductase flavoprotein subunit alpha [Stenotrophobium rhamnosiphilum]PTU33197.1 sulfite reductase subunit alpha [Stenotrophobium rhamnosiphilum]
MSEWLLSVQGQRVLHAAAVVFVWLLFCAFIAWRRIRQQRRLSLPTLAGDTPLLLCYASQTGYALRIAMQTAKSLQAAGQSVNLKSLGDVDLTTLQSSSRALFVVSTTGEGDPPDTAITFVRKVMRGQSNLKGLNYGLLALGDQEYRHYCGFGRELDRWLKRHGAQPLFDAVEVDNADEGALRHWQHHLELLGDGQAVPDWTEPEYEDWRLVERTLLNAGSAGGAVYHLSLEPQGKPLTWSAGDIVEIGPRNSQQKVNEALKVLGLPAATVLRHEEREEVLSDWLARCLLPRQLEELTQQLVENLKPLPHREYSIASIPKDGRLELLLRQMRQSDGSLGLGSGWLTEHAKVGETIAVRIRSNPSFHAPTDDRPVILIGNGTGLAGLRAHIKARVAAGHRRNWLLFGERSADHDFYHREEIEGWRNDGFLQRVDLAFSRDQSERIYVQQRLSKAADEVRRWVSDGASIHVCGSLEGMAPAVTAVLNDILGAEQLEQLAADGRYRRDVY